MIEAGICLPAVCKTRSAARWRRSCFCGRYGKIVRYFQSRLFLDIVLFELCSGVSTTAATELNQGEFAKWLDRLRGIGSCGCYPAPTYQYFYFHCYSVGENNKARIIGMMVTIILLRVGSSRLFLNSLMISAVIIARCHFSTSLTYFYKLKIPNTRHQTA